MSNRVTGKTLKTAAIVGLFAGATALSGCSSLGGLGFDRTTTGSVNAAAPMNTSQPMPRTLTAPVAVAENRFIPPADIGGNGPGATVIGSNNMGGQPLGSVSTEDLPVLTSSANGSNQMMPAAKPLSPVPATPTLASAPASSSLVSIPSDAYVHVIESGESLYTIARRYNVTAQAIIQANGFSSPDKIFVGQKIVIPGKASALAAMGPKGGSAPAADPAEKPVAVASLEQQPRTPLATVKPLEAKPAETMAEARPLEQPKAEPVLSGADKFRWPISGRVITDFANSKGTGINIEAPEGAAVRAAENGQVIYAGSGVEGYGNLILIRHPNGYVSAYAHLKDMNVAKGTVVNRGDNIGTAGKTGSVSKSQLHFELRKGATPVDPLPLLAS
ncbi:MAG: peptidoglycan DD-metalloendopeptidase family protein [Devosia sp.]|uniref:peptidoglycan DD-metalloendopeptidase family protein n=1 Tax=Devosia sp. TaxID=1871048 RepID=UPI00261026F4|nr:peptidoglycan DD-metalloendopeptidase family protein [Devosia sp.]MDB5539591.1 peptidoglycan DD-metalloendopeptidase family protein [Devosia sp.]